MGAFRLKPHTRSWRHLGSGEEVALFNPRAGSRPQPKVRMRAPAEPPATCPCYEGGHDPVGDDTPNPPGTP